MTKLKQVSVVFHQYETGVRSGTIKPGVTKYEINFVCAKITPNNKTNRVSLHSLYWVTVSKQIVIDLLSDLSKIVSWNDQAHLSQKRFAGGLHNRLYDKSIVPSYSLRPNNVVPNQTDSVPKQDIQHTNIRDYK